MNWRLFARWAGFALWLAAVSIPLAYLSGFHLLPLPAPAQESLGVVGGSQWTAVHILATDCGCSDVVATYLVGRHRNPEMNEAVWLIGDDPVLSAKLSSAGFDVSHWSAEELATRYGISGVPWFVLCAPDGAPLYSGGYGSQSLSDARQIQDLTIWHAVRAGKTPQPYPAFGCATAQALRAALDPLNLKRR